MSAPRAYPARIDARLDEPLSRWLWLVKWLLLVPHYICLAVLYLVFVVTTVIAFFSILFTGRYPRAIFDLNVGILRWGWRVSFYGNGAFGTDRYPPFTLADVPDYPAHFDVEYPGRLSRGLVLVKWWLLALPHYLIVGILVGGGLWTSASHDTGGDWRWSWGSGGLVALLSLVAVVVVLFTGTYPKSLFDLVVGFDRWALRVMAYAGLMTDEYPPFRLDLGGRDPATPEEPTLEHLGERAPGGTTARWTGGRTALAISGSVMVLVATGPLLAGAVLGGAGLFGRDSAGYLSTPQTQVVSVGRAVVTDGLQVEANGPTWAMPDRTLGTVRVRATASDPARAVFVGIAPADDVRTWLANSAYSTVDNLDNSKVTYVQHTGSAVPAAPSAQTFWVARATGNGSQSVTWTAKTGTWAVVVANADVSPGVDVRADVGATVPALGWIAGGLLAVGLAILAVGAVLVLVAVTGAGRRSGPSPTGTPPAPVLSR